MIVYNYNPNWWLNWLWINANRYWKYINNKGGCIFNWRYIVNNIPLFKEFTLGIFFSPWYYGAGLGVWLLFQWCKNIGVKLLHIFCKLLSIMNNKMMPQEKLLSESSIGCILAKYKRNSFLQAEYLFCTSAYYFIAK